ncbi:uncharacterized protein [Mytilus edulis]|uniref:uncharacterized protein n=1 Tax=Mytilus edulis TaxID=6550 RepID=UPI0039F00EF8
MYLSPLNIFYTNVEHLSEDLLTETDLERKVKSYKDKEQIPKLQVFYKCGRYFTLNNAELRVCRKLQNDGFCHRIKVEKVPVKRIPKGILDTMEVPETDCPITRDTTKRSKTGYRQLTVASISKDPDFNDKAEQTDDSLSSCTLDSSDDGVSEDGKQDELDTDDWVSSSDHSTESEVEEEEESFL